MPLATARHLAAVAALVALACGGSNSSTTGGFDDRQIIVDYADQVVVPTYALLATRAEALGDAVVALVNARTPENLAAARAAWVAARQPWEQSEGFLFGPVDTSGYDPAIDSWPVNKTDLDNVLGDHEAQDFTTAFVASLENTQKGFHTIEYLIYGEGGAKTAAELTDKEAAYLSAITAEFISITYQLRDAWTSGYRDLFAGAGTTGNTTYASLSQAADEILGGMITICDEVANAKIADPYDAHDPTLVESQFSYNSILDFQDNMRSIENAYTGTTPIAGTAGRGLTTFVAARDAALDARVKAEIQAAIAALGAISDPFPIAIDDPAAAASIEAAQLAIRTLNDTLVEDVRPLVVQ